MFSATFRKLFQFHFDCKIEIFIKFKEKKIKLKYLTDRNKLLKNRRKNKSTGNFLNKKQLEFLIHNCSLYTYLIDECLMKIFIT